MSTGALGVLLALTPNRFPGLTTIGKIAFIIDLILFVCLTAMIAARFILVPSSFYYSLHNPTESLFFGAFWVSVALILQNIELYGQPYAGPWLTKALEICFWVYAAIVFVVGVFQYHTLFNEEKLSVANMMPVWILPIYPFVVAGPTAGILLGSQPPSEGFPMLVGGVMFQGLGWIVAHFMYTIYIARLMTSELPEPYMRPGMYISVGPVCEFDCPLLGVLQLTLPSIYRNSFDCSRESSEGHCAGRVLPGYTSSCWRCSQNHRLRHGNIPVARRLLVLHAVQRGNRIWPEAFHLRSHLVGFHLSQLWSHGGSYPD